MFYLSFIILLRATQPNSFEVFAQPTALKISRAIEIMLAMISKQLIKRKVPQPWALARLL